MGLCDHRECLLFPPSGPGCSSSAPAPRLSPLSLPGSLCVLSSKIYTADLESALHYILRIEVGKFSVLEGQRLVALKKFMAVLAQVSGALGPLIRQLHTGPRLVLCLPGGISPAPSLGPDLWTHQPSQSTVGCCPVAPVTRPPAPQDNLLPLCREVGGTWHQMRGGYSHLHTSACLSPPPQAEPGLWPLTPCRDHWERRSCGPHSEGMRASLSLFFPLSDSELEGAPWL